MAGYHVAWAPQFGAGHPPSLATSIIEAHGMFWAWFIRVLQDLVLVSVVTAQDLDVSASQVVRRPGEDMPSH